MLVHNNNSNNKKNTRGGKKRVTLEKGISECRDRFLCPANVFVKH